MGRSRMVTACTTKTRTSRTTRFPISSLSIILRTSGFTPVASCETESGGSHVGCAACSSPSLKSTGTSLEKVGSGREVGVGPVTSKKSCEQNSFGLHAVEAVEEIPYSGSVWNLTVEGSPTFQTRVGLSHNTMKPTELIIPMLKNSAKKGEIVADPFLGSGSTLIAAAMSERICFGAELDPAYCDVIRRRWGEYARSADMDPGKGAL